MRYKIIRVDGHIPDEMDGIPYVVGRGGDLDAMREWCNQSISKGLAWELMVLEEDTEKVVHIAVSMTPEEALADIERELRQRHMDMLADDPESKQIRLLMELMASRFRQIRYELRRNKK